MLQGHLVGLGDWSSEVGEGNVNALSAIIGGQLRVGFISEKILEAGAAIVCGQVGYKSLIYTVQPLYVARWATNHLYF